MGLVLEICIWEECNLEFCMVLGREKIIIRIGVNNVAM